MGVKLWWLLLIKLTISHILITTYSHYNKIILCTAGLIFMYMARTALESLQTLDLSSFLLNGYLVFSPGERRQHMKLSAQHQLHPPIQKYTTTQVKTSWHVDRASLHIDITLLFPELEPGNRTANFTQVSLYQSAKKHTHTQKCKQYVATAHTMEFET